MAYIIPELRNDDVTMIELTDRVLGGKGNIANMQAQQLINRLLYIEKALSDYLDSKKDDNISYINRVIFNASLISNRVNVMKQHSDASAVVYTYTDLLNYDTTKLYDNNVVKVLSDETHDYYCTYYRWHESTDTYSYIGYENRSPFYIVDRDSTINIDDETTIVVTGNNCNLTLTCSISGTVVRIVNTVPYYLNSQLVQPSTRTYMYLSGWVEYDAYNICRQEYLPVGSTIVTFNTDDISSYKGTWSMLSSGYALMSAALTDTALTTGGNGTSSTVPSASCASHSLTTAEIPSHSITVNSWSGASASGTHKHSFTGRQINQLKNVRVSSAKTATFYWNSGTTGSTTGASSSSHGHGQGSASTSNQGSGSGHSHTITFNASSVDVHQRMMYVYVWRRTA